MVCWNSGRFGCPISSVSTPADGGPFDQPRPRPVAPLISLCSSLDLARDRQPADGFRAAGITAARVANGLSRLVDVAPSLTDACRRRLGAADSLFVVRNSCLLHDFMLIERQAEAATAPALRITEPSVFHRMKSRQTGDGAAALYALCCHFPPVNLAGFCWFRLEGAGARVGRFCLYELIAARRSCALLDQQTTNPSRLVWSAAMSHFRKRLRIHSPVRGDRCEKPRRRAIQPVDKRRSVSQENACTEENTRR